MKRYRALKGITAVVYGTFGVLFLMQPGFLFATVTLNTLLVASKVLGGMFAITALLAAHGCITGNLNTLTLARIGVGWTAMGMAGIYFYSCFLFGWGAILGVLVWTQIGLGAFLRQLPVVEETAQMASLIAEVKTARDQIGED